MESCSALLRTGLALRRLKSAEEIGYAREIAPTQQREWRSVYVDCTLREIRFQCLNELLRTTAQDSHLENPLFGKSKRQKGLKMHKNVCARPGRHAANRLAVHISGKGCDIDGTLLQRESGSPY